MGRPSVGIALHIPCPGFDGKSMGVSLRTRRTRVCLIKRLDPGRPFVSFDSRHIGLTDKIRRIWLDQAVAFLLFWVPLTVQRVER